MTCEDAGWFERFVEETIIAWAKRTRRSAAYDENPATAVIASRGEEHVLARLKRRGYEVVQSPGSRSPADVWGRALASGIVHVPIVQVKASGRGQPAQLSTTARNDLAMFAAFTFERYVGEQQRSSGFGSRAYGRFARPFPVPLAGSDAPVVVSAWYAGVRTARETKLVGWDRIAITPDRSLGSTRVKRMLAEFDVRFGSTG